MNPERPLEIRPMPLEEFERISEIDRAEHIKLSYQVVEGELVSTEVDWDVPSWFRHGDGDHHLPAKLKAWRPYLEQYGGTMWGAFDRDRMAGFIILRPNLREGLAQLAVLHVSRAYRRRGVATLLSEQLLQAARAGGARRVYVSSTPSQSAVGFYRTLGFELTDEPIVELFEHEPDDIHMIKSI